MIKFEEQFVNEQRLPLVWQITSGRDTPIEEVTAFLKEHRSALEAARDRHGAVLIRGFEAIDSAPRFHACLDVLVNRLMDYVGGSAPREVVYGRVTTASGLPGNFSLALHQEMAYQADRPDALALFCEIPAADGGETPLADARVVTTRIDPAVRARFEAGRIGVMRAMPGPEKGKPNTVPRPWSDVLCTTDRDEAERVAAAKGWGVEWLPDGSMHLWQALQPAFRAHPRTGERVWANQVHYHMPECWIRWAERDGRHDDVARLREQMARAPEELDLCFHDGRQRVSGDDAEHVWDVLEAAEIPHRWERGDVMFIDNVIAMHGRRWFRGKRSILVGLIKDQ